MKQRIKSGAMKQSVLTVSVLAGLSCSGIASAFVFDTGNPDIQTRWDNTLRYNAGWRMQDPSWDLIRPAATAGPSNYKFKEKGGMITNRVDLLTEFDFVYKGDTGFRVSAAGWYDQRYQNDTLRGHPTSGVFFAGGKYPDEVKRYYGGPSGEFLDAFVFTKFNLGSTPVDAKLGQHTVYWGETLFSLASGVSAGQSYADLRKALATPGVEAKEVFKPLNQFSFSATVSDELQLMGQYFFDYKIDLFPLAGTYFSPADFLVYQGTTTVNPAVPIIWDGVRYNNVDKHGDFGLAAKWRPQWLDGTAGFYYRQYTPKNSAALAVAAGGPLTGGIYVDGDLPRTKLYGFSLSKLLGKTSFGMDLTYRKDATLQTKSFHVIPSLTATGWAPVGDLYTATFNAIAYLGKNAVFDSAALTTELTYDALDKITKNAQAANSRQNCVTGTSFLNAGSPNQGYYGCFTGQSLGISIRFEPVWYSVFEGVDMKAPLFITRGLGGNSPVPAVGANEGQGSYSLGVSAEVRNAYIFTLQYNGQLYQRKQRPTGVPFTNASLGDFSDRNWLSFTAKTSF